MAFVSPARKGGDFLLEAPGCERQFRVTRPGKGLANRLVTCWRPEGQQYFYGFRRMLNSPVQLETGDRFLLRLIIPYNTAVNWPQERVHPRMP